MVRIHVAEDHPNAIHRRVVRYEEKNEIEISILRHICMTEKYSIF